ncbi:MAG: hypothetical protein ABIA74_02990 [bacterium]
MKGIFQINLFALSLISFFSLNALQEYKTPFSNISSSLVLSDTTSQFCLANGSSLIGWKGGTLVEFTEPDRIVNYKDQTVFNALDSLRLKKEYVFEARSYLNSFNLAGIPYYDKAWGGDVSQISVGSAANVWAIKGSKFYFIDIDGETQIEDQKFPWHEKGDAPLLLSAGRENTVWGIGGAYGGLTSGAPYAWDDKNLTWIAKPVPGAINDFFDLSVCDKNHIWALGVNYGGPTYYVYNWHNESNQWIDRSVGALYPDKSISVGGDGLIDIIILGVHGDAGGDKLVIWDRTTEAWNEVSLGLSGHTIDNISVGRRDNIGIIITPGGSPYPIFYKLEKLSKTAPYSAILTEVRKETSLTEMGYYGDAWCFDPYLSYWYRLVGGVIRSVINYLAQMPNITSMTGLRSVPSGYHEEEGFTTNSDTTLEDPETIWVAPEALESPLSLNGGTMQLQSDLYFSSTTYIMTGGKIAGSGYAIFLGNDLSLYENQSLQFTDTTVIDGLGAALTLHKNAKLKIDNGVTLSLRNLVLKGLQDAANSVIEMSENSFLSFQNVEIELSGDYTFTQGVLFLDDDLKITGTSKLIYESNMPWFINPHSTIYFDLGTTLSYVPNSGARDLFKLSDATSVLYLDQSTFAAPANGTYNGILLTKGTMVFDNYVNLKNLNNGIPNTDINKAITLGDGAAENSVDTKVLSGAMVNIAGYLDYNPN